MIAGLDSATPPTAQQVQQAKQAGFAIWSGYLATKPGVHLYHPWTHAEFGIAWGCGSKPIAYASGADDPIACRDLAFAWNVRLCLDVENGIRGDGPWVQDWLIRSGAGLYGNAPVHHWLAPFHILAGYPGHDPRATWSGQRPNTPCAWQWQGTHSAFGIGVDSTWFDDWFKTETGEEIMHKSLKDTIVRLAWNVRSGTDPAIPERDFWADQIKDDGSNTEDIYVKIVTNPGGPEYRAALAKAIAGAPTPTTLAPFDATITPK